MKPALFLVAAAIILFSPRPALAKKFVLVGVSGLATGRDDGSRDDIFSDKLCAKCQASGVWSTLPKGDPHIEKRAFLTHFSTSEEVEKVLELVSDESGRCRANVGLIIMANSWGASVANQLSDRYFSQCGRRTDIFIMVDGVQKPITLAYSKAITAEKCLNMYQTVDVVHGGSLSNCKNIDLTKEAGITTSAKWGDAHIRAEWTGSALGAAAIAAALKQAK